MIIVFRALARGGCASAYDDHWASWTFTPSRRRGNARAPVSLMVRHAVEIEPEAGSVIEPLLHQAQLRGRFRSRGRRPERRGGQNRAASRTIVLSFAKTRPTRSGSFGIRGLRPGAGPETGRPCDRHPRIRPRTCPTNRIDDG